MSLVVGKFKEVCILYKEKPAFVYDKKGKLTEKTFGELEAEVDSVRAYLYHKGVRCGDKILAFATPSYELCLFMLASLSIGASIMYVDFWAKQDRLKNAFEQYRPDFVLVSKTTARVRFLFREIHMIKNTLYVDGNMPDLPKKTYKDTADISEDTVALLTLTTGSTGKPKAAIRTHGQLHEQLMLVCGNMDIRNKNEYVLTTSFMYVFSNIMNGFTTVLPRLRLGRSSGAKLDRQLSVYTSLPISMIITSPDFCLSVSTRFPKLKRLYFGGAILTIHEAEAIRSKFGYSEINYIYGATECNLISVTRLDDYISELKENNRSVLGTPAIGVNVRTNEKYEIMVTGKALLERYLVQSEQTSKENDKDHVVWHKTGDAGEMKDGKLVYYGRCDKKLTFKDGAFSSQLEQLICVRFAQIEKCAVCTKQNGQNKVWVFVVCPNAKRSYITELYSYLQTQLPTSEIKVKKLRKMPCDVKHHTKINYKALQRKMN